MSRDEESRGERLHGDLDRGLTEQLAVRLRTARRARLEHEVPAGIAHEPTVAVHAAAPGAMVIVVHLEAINHCLETRSYYRERLPELGVPMDRVRIPGDGESVIW